MHHGPHFKSKGIMPTACGRTVPEAEFAASTPASGRSSPTAASSQSGSIEVVNRVGVVHSAVEDIQNQGRSQHAEEAAAAVACVASNSRSAAPSDQVDGDYSTGALRLRELDPAIQEEYSQRPKPIVAASGLLQIPES